ncbi:MAG: hypothetical protein HQ464_02675 [Planctomycetes bacterium]|nr:hypothetical protein [Planctomycetota bacterium]
MSVSLREIADLLAASLADTEFDAADVQPSVQRSNWPTYDIHDMQSPVIAVTPVAAELTRASRVDHQYDYSVGVFLGRHAPTDALADDMFDLMEELLDVIRRHDWDESLAWPAGVTSPVEVEVEINPEEALQERNVWRAQITVTYRVHKGAA